MCQDRSEEMKRFANGFICEEKQRKMVKNSMWAEIVPQKVEAKCWIQKFPARMFNRNLTYFVNA
jgi:hypothetical protein